MQPKSSGITGKARETLARILDHVLAEECSLSTRTRDYRWNLTGPQLYSLHRLFEEQRQQLEFWVGQLITRTKSLGLSTPARDANEGNDIQRAARGAGLPPRTMIGDLLSRHETLAQELAQGTERLGDPVVADLLQRLQEFHETAAWMLRMLHNGPEPAA
jgi:starvation-inducible DNA-binding protein